MSLLLMLWLTVIPQNEILVKGATPSASDTSTPVPEQGRIADGRYRNAYFGLSYPIPAGWKEQPAGPPPSDGGSYVLTQFATARAHVLVTAQDLFFSAIPVADSAELLHAVRRRLAYEIESEPHELLIGGRKFHRLVYRAPRSGLQWRILTTDARCHALTFTFAGTDPGALDAAEQALRGITLGRNAPLCIREYDRVVSKSDPVFFANRYNSVPVRVIVDAKGRVKHAHVLSAFPDQSQAILAAVRTWRFEPHRAGEIETGFMFGNPPRKARD